MPSELDLPALAVHCFARLVDDQGHWLVRELWGQHLIVNILYDEERRYSGELILMRVLNCQDIKFDHLA